jgi:hypothetical protein
MSSTASSLENILTMLCTGIICLLPFAGIAGGVLFFRRRRKKSAQQTTAPAADKQPAQAAMPSAAGLAVSASAHLAPSELVLLRADAFAPAAGMLNSYKLLGSEKKVEAPALVKTLFAAAFLALEEAGDIRLETRRRKVTLGLREIDSLYVLPTHPAGGWPAGSFEQQILAAAASAVEKQQNYIQHIVYTVVGDDSNYPWGYTIEKAQRGLAARGLLAVTKEKVLLATRERMSLPPDTGLAAQQADIAPIENMLARCQQERPQLWKILIGEVNAAVKDRVEASDSDGPDFDID